ncbi:hypothetical protein SAMN04487983_102115 [Streptomyces sp. yr375]|nr:hypothetical protein SAMN04487983_102115 [Streptomyces sp. yr375]
MPLPCIRLQQLQHHRIISPPIPRQRPPHDPRQMQIPHRHRIRRPMTALHGLRRRPRPDPRHHLQPSPRILRSHPHRLLHPPRHPHGPQNRRRPLVVDTRPMPLPRRNQRPRPRRRHHPQPPTRRRPRRRLPELPHQQPPRPIRLVGRDLLLQHGRDQRLQHQPGPRQPEPRPPMPGHRDHPMPRHERLRRVSGPEQLRQPLQQPLGPRPPGLPPHHTTTVHRGDPQRPRPGRRETGPPHGPVRHHPERGITGPPPKRPQHQPKIKRPVRYVLPHQPSLISPRPGTLPRHPDIPTAHGRTRGPGREPSCHDEVPGSTKRLLRE